MAMPTLPITWRTTLYKPVAAVMNGIEFLKVVKNDESLKSIPVIMLTTSEEPKDKTRSFDLGVAGYMAKPVEYRRFVDMIRSIDCYWTLSELP